MKLHSVRVREFKSIRDSNTFQVGQVTCLVGKNEAGKTALLQALYRLNPLVASDAKFDATDDYPRSDVESYRQDVESDQRPPATIINATFKLDPSEVTAIELEFGAGVLSANELELSRGYTKAGSTSDVAVSLQIDEPLVVRHYCESFNLPEPIRADASKNETLSALAAFLTTAAKTQATAVTAANERANTLTDEPEKAAAMEAAKSLGESEQAKALRQRLSELQKQGPLHIHVFQKHLQKHVPKFLYFDSYYQMRGYANIDSLKQRKKAGTLEPPDHPLLGLIELARLDLDNLVSTTRTQELKNKLQGASNHLTQQVLQYWSQNKHLRMTFDVRQGMSGDPEGMREGFNIWGEVEDTKHLVSTSLGTRSTGFVWFFSFLAWYSAVKKKNEPLVLLLDEPGTSLHGRAQEDLLRFFETQIVKNEKHQLLYTTHSPFMVDPHHPERIRIVQDRGIDTTDFLPPEEDGTKVLTEVLEAGPDSLFPLQGALGYEIYQTLFVGPNSLVVEGVSDLLYLQTVSEALISSGRVGLAKEWTITPVGGSDKVPTFVALLGSQSKLNVAVLIDLQKKDQQTIENLYKKRLLEKSHVLTYADFTGTTEADVEDMFGVAFYLQLVNGEFSRFLTGPIAEGDVTPGRPRILVRLDDYFKTHPMQNGVSFSHYRPARYFTEHVGKLTIPPEALDRFEMAFTSLNKLVHR